MFYHQYNTEAFVLGSRPSGEGSKYVYLFTKELGLLGAHAQGSREIKSKLRYALDDLSHSKVSLVKGKSTWRLTNAVPHKNFFVQFRLEHEKLRLCANALAIIKKLVAGEEKNIKLFEILEQGFAFLEENNLSEDDIHNAEAIFMLRILNNLGYFGASKTLENFALTDEWNQTLLQEMSRERRNAVFVINKSLEASHL
jgi:DNA repair protein RecO